MKEICVLSFLAWNTWSDIRRKQISLWLTAVFGAAGILAAIGQGRWSWEILVSAVISCGFLGLGILTEGAIGLGDGWILLALGTVLTLREYLTVLLTGMGCCAVWAFILLMFRRCGRQTEIPFVPFLLLGYLGGVWLWR